MHANETPYLLFLHIMKTGGMTMQRMLRTRYGPSVVARLIDKLFRLQTWEGLPIEEAVARLSPQRSYLAGHFGYGVHRLTTHPCTYITLVRNPIERLVSLYHYSRDTHDAYYHEQARGKSLEEFLLETELHELDNGQLRFIAGDSPGHYLNRTRFGQCDESLLNQAKQNICRDFLLAGTLEEFDAFALLLGRKLGWKHSYYLRMNEGKPSVRSQLSSRVRVEVERRQHWDLELYEWVRARFREQVSAEGPRFESLLAEFRRRNAAYQRRWSKPYAGWLRLKQAAGHNSMARRYFVDETRSPTTNDEFIADVKCPKKLEAKVLMSEPSP